MKACFLWILSLGDGNSIRSCVLRTDAELEAEIITYCREHLTSIKCPRSVDFDAELPRHENGKLYKRLIKDRYWGRHDTRIV